MHFGWLKKVLVRTWMEYWEMLRFFLVFFPFIIFLRICLYERSLDTCLGMFCFFPFSFFILSLLSWKGFAPVGWLGHLGFHPFTLSLTLSFNSGQTFLQKASLFPSFFLMTFMIVLFTSASSSSSSAAIVYVLFVFACLSVVLSKCLNTS